MLVLVAYATALAIPAKPMWRTINQPDGTTIRLMLVGDERLHYFITADSVPVLEYNDAFYYADGIGFGMKRLNLLAHEANVRTALEASTAKAASVNRIEALRPYRNQNLFRPTRLLRARVPAASSSSYYTSDRRNITGEHKSIVVLCEFPNRKFLSSHDSTYYWNMVNEEGYTNSHGAIGSVHDYFYDQSAGQLDLTFDVVGPIEMEYDYSHYGGSSSSGDDDNGWEFAYEALMKVDSIYPELNWHDYDWDGDGEVENLYLIYAGYGQATGGPASTLWPAQTNFDDYNSYYPTYYGWPAYNVVFDGVKINTFAYGNELYGRSGSTPMGMGVMTHEFSHCLGYPDLYNTDYSNAADMGSWSILASGSYGGPSGIGWVPSGYTAYEKWAAGWIDFKEFSVQNDTITGLSSTFNGGDAYVIYNDKLRQDSLADALEYFLLENRTKNRWDTYLPAQGLEVLHVNYERSVWENNSVNTPNSYYGGNGHSNLVLVPADNNANGYERGDLYPYNGKDSITPNSQPSLTFYNSQLDGSTVYKKPIVNITWNSADSTVSFIFNPVDTMFTPAPSISASPIAASANSNSSQYFRDSTVVTITAELGNIRYSTDSVNWTEYSEPFIIADDSTIVYAYAYREGKNDSKVSQVLFIKQMKLDAPVISGDSVFVTSTTITITADRGRIKYRSSPRVTSFRNYSRPLTIRASTTVYAFAESTDNAYYSSDTVSMVVRKLEVCQSPQISVNKDSTAIEITSAETNGQIWYSIDSTNFSEYSAPIVINNDSMSVWAYVSAEGKLSSDTVRFDFVRPVIDNINSIIADLSSGNIRIFTIDGKSIVISDGNDTRTLRPGIYVIRDDEGRNHKIVVK